MSFYMPPTRIRHERDGNRICTLRDAPGKSSVYIPPGNAEAETYRLATFGRYPKQVPVSVTKLAHAGFLYTGYKDRVKCFSCGLSVENWTIGDDVTDKRWHKNDCLMTTGTDGRNVPAKSSWTLFLDYLPNSTQSSNNQGQTIPFHSQHRPTSSGFDASQLRHSPIGAVNHYSTEIPLTTRNNERIQAKMANIVCKDHQQMILVLDLTKEVDRRKTYAKWPAYPAPNLPPTLAEEGFYYLGNLDRVQCFSCSGVLRNWSREDDVRLQHRENFPNCRIVLTIEDRNEPSSNQAIHETSQQACASAFATNNIQEPADPDIQHQMLINQFFPCNDPIHLSMKRENDRKETFDHRWPSGRIRASVDQIAAAGFFYLGIRDKTKCWYCNGGLQNWELDDEPWTEHAKWFPGCEFVIAKKGPDFVRRTVEAYPNLNRPPIQNPVSYEAAPASLFQSQSHVRLAESNYIVTALSSPIVKEALDMGFERSLIQAAVERKRSQYGSDYSCTEELINELLSIKPTKSSLNFQDVLIQSVVPIPGVCADIENNNQDHLKNALDEMHQTGLCKVCFRDQADNVFQPCGHLAACSKCAPSARRCMLCKTKVESYLKIFRA